MPITDHASIYPQLKLDYEEILRVLTKQGYKLESLPIQQRAYVNEGEAFASAYPIQGLLKYHGMVNPKARIAMFPSISLNNGAFQTVTYVKFDARLSRDKFILDGVEKATNELDRVQYQLQQIRNYAKVSTYALVISRNISKTKGNIPIIAKGIGTSASGGAAIAKAAMSILYHDPNISDNPRLLSIFSRFLSGSAARSSVGGIALWLNHPLCDSWDSYAIGLNKPEVQEFVTDLSLITIPIKSTITTSSAHKIAPESPLYKSWCLSRKEKILQFLDAVSDHDLDKLGMLAEEDSKMLHDIHITTSKGEPYWNDDTQNIIKLTQDMRDDGIPIYFSIDTGPSVVLLTYKKFREEITEILMKNLKNSLPIISGSIMGPSTLITEESNLQHILDDDIEKYSNTL